MMMSEFVERTGFQPSADEYRNIEEAYYNFPGNKDEFCKDFTKNNGVRRIADERLKAIERLRSQMLELEREFKAEGEKLRKENGKLRDELDRELEWKPCTTAGTNMSQKDYEYLLSSGKTMTDDEAIAFIADECGFSPNKVRLIHEVKTYDVDKHSRLRTADIYKRSPVYESSDWNYVRFDCACMTYEMVNGDLHFYCH